MKPTVHTRLHALAAVTVVGCLSAMAISWPLWVAERTIPAVPWIDGLPRIGAPWDWVLLGAFAAAALCAAVWARSSLALGACVALAVAIGVQDVIRAQPWFFEYVLIFWLLFVRARLGTSDAAARRCLHACTLLIAAVYLYSGLTKLNHTYLHDVFPKLVESFIAKSAESEGWLLAAAWASVIMETFIGVAILLRPTRRAAVIAVTLMHIAILVCLGPLGRNENGVVWPWNLTMIAICWLVAWRKPERATGEDKHAASRQWLWQAPVLILACIMPAFGLAHVWPAYLSWSMYSGGEPELVIGMSTPAMLEAPASLRPYLEPIDGTRIQHAVVLAKWVGGETGGRAMPEEWYYRALATHLLKQFPKLDGVIVVDLPRAPRWLDVAKPGQPAPERPRAQMSGDEYLTRHRAP